MAEALCWICALAVVHTYLGYPAWLVALSALAGVRSDLAYLAGRIERRRGGEGDLPRITLVVAAWNEAAVIGAKLENSLALDWPADRLEVLVGSDGSDDGTDELVRAVAAREPRVRLVPGRVRAGKASVLNRTVPLSRGEVVVLTDANTLLAPDALRRLAPHFARPAVGAVCGNLRLYNPKRKGYEESAYWRYESFLKLHEGRRGAVLGANGGLYAIRRRLFAPLPPDTIVDDFVSALRLLERGYAVTYEPAAVAFEETTEDYAKERVRRVRIAAGNFQALARHGGLLHPRHGFVAFAFLSHKLLRWLAPVFLAVLLPASLVLALEGRPLGLAALVAQLVVYGLSLLGRLRPPEGRLGALASAARYFVEMNLGLLQGLGRFLRGSQKATWQRTARVG